MTVRGGGDEPNFPARPRPSSSPGARRPWATYGFGIALAVAYLIESAAPDLVLVEGGLLPAEIDRRPWTALTAVFLHSLDGPWHLAANLLSLWIFGQYVEPYLGRARLLVALLIGGLGGSAAVLAVAAAVPGERFMLTVGASGAIFALLGLSFLVPRPSRAVVGGLLVLLGVNAAYSLMTPSVSWQGHLGGLATGILLGLVVRASRFLPAPRLALWLGWCLVLALVVWVAAAGAGVYA